jgi:hypothetical protein
MVLSIESLLLPIETQYQTQPIVKKGVIKSLAVFISESRKKVGTANMQVFNLRH